MLYAAEARGIVVACMCRRPMKKVEFVVREVEFEVRGGEASKYMFERDSKFERSLCRNTTPDRRAELRRSIKRTCYGKFFDQFEVGGKFCRKCSKCRFS